MNTMKCFKQIAIGIVAVTIVGAFCLVSAEGKITGEKKVVKKVAPEVVMMAFKTAYPDATINGVEKSAKDGQVSYKIESKDGNVRRDVIYTAEAVLTEVDEAIAVGNLPEAITKAVAVQYPKGKITEAQKTERGTTTEYDLHVKNNKENIELVLDTNGIIVSTHKVLPGEKEHEYVD
ncbi:MAG: hypothetical protein PHC61_07450 [Chitinivibrionales bacterium]|nr:hypothetical protein [Chitinivibrionales bacterium]